MDLRLIPPLDRARLLNRNWGVPQESLNVKGLLNSILVQTLADSTLSKGTPQVYLVLRDPSTPEELLKQHFGAKTKALSKGTPQILRDSWGTPQLRFNSRTQAIHSQSMCEQPSFFSISQTLWASKKGKKKSRSLIAFLSRMKNRGPALMIESKEPLLLWPSRCNRSLFSSSSRRVEFTTESVLHSFAVKPS